MYALVTGGSRGIGRAICLRLATKGYQIIINYKSNKLAANETLNLIQQNGGSGEILQFDVSLRDETRNAIEQWYDNHNNDCIEILVNNAGVRRDNLMALMTDDDWNQVVETNLGGFYTVTKALLFSMIRNKYGRIVNVVSLSGIKGMAGQTNYSAAKAGIIAATKSLALEIGRKNITVNCVAPGFIKTDMTENIKEEDYKSFIPLRRFGTADEVASVVEFLASQEAAYVTGEVISVNGGLYT